MSGLDIFEELRYIIELLLAEYMFAYYLQKEKRIWFAHGGRRSVVVHDFGFLYFYPADGCGLWR